MTESSASPSSAPRANSCSLCPTPKPAAWCRGCPRETAIGDDFCHYVNANLVAPADVVIVAEAPVVPRIQDVRKIHLPFTDDSGALVEKAIASVRTAHPGLGAVDVAKTYAVLCTGMDPNKETLDRCNGFLLGSLKRATKDPAKPPILVAMGAMAVKALGIKAKSLKDVMNRVLPAIDVGGVSYTVVVTLSTKMLIAQPGMYNIFLSDLQRAMEMAATGVPTTIPLAELTKDYIIPKTVEGVKAVCELIENYSDEGKDPGKWSISVDTETNTKFPHRKDTKIVAISFAWASGKATCIPLWHKDAPYDPQLVVPYVLRVMGSSKPKIMHNGKYDLKVFRFLGWELNNWAWDSMLGEHVLEEDKKGQYSLKQLTRVHHPQFAAYADKLHELLTALEGDTQLDNAAKKKKEALAADPLAGKKRKSKKKEDKGGFENIPLDDLLLYGAVDADMTRRIAVAQLGRMDEEQRRIDGVRALLMRDAGRRFPVPNVCVYKSPSKSVVNNTALPVSKVLAKMEFDGIRVDRAYAEELCEKLETVVQTEEQALYKMAGGQIKLNAAAQIAEVLFSKGFIHPETGVRTFYPSEAKTKGNQDQTTEKVMKALVKKYKCPFAAKKLIYSKAFKARNTFLENMLTLSELDGRVHGNYSIHGTGTGRLSSFDPNLQNIPKKLSGYSLKKIFVPTDDSMVFVNCDAKSAEVKIFAAYSQDQALIEALRNGLDAHSFFASKIIEGVRLAGDADVVLKEMGLDDARPLIYEDFANRDAIKAIDPSYGEMLGKFRDSVKRVVFGILYGAGPSKIAETAGISKTDAQAVIDLLFGMFPSIPKYVESTKWELWKFGCVETYFGRRRRVQVKGLQGYLRSRAERQSVNFKIQSTSSDIVLGRLVDVAAPLERDLRGKLLLTVHDSIGFEIPKRYLSQLPAFVDEYLIKQARVKHPWLPVDFTWDYEVGNSYGELQSYAQYVAANTIQEEVRNELEEAYEESEVIEDLATDAA